MSVSGNYSGALSKPTIVAIGTSATDIAAYEQQLTIVASMLLANTAASAIQIDLSLVQGGLSAVFWTGRIPAHSTVSITDAPIRLYKDASGNDKITATGTNTGVNITTIVLAGSGNDAVYLR